MTPTILEQLTPILTNIHEDFTVTGFHDFANNNDLNITIYKGAYSFGIYTGVGGYPFSVYVGPHTDVETILIDYLYDIDATEYKQVLGSLCISTIAHMRNVMSTHNLTFANISEVIKSVYMRVYADDNSMLDFAKSTVWLSFLHADTDAPTALDMYAYFRNNIGAVALLLYFVRWDIISYAFNSMIVFLPDILAPDSKGFPILSKTFRQ